MSVVTPEIRFFADCHWLMADNIILLRITPMLPYEWSNLRRLFDCNPHSKHEADRSTTGAFALNSTGT